MLSHVFTLQNPYLAPIAVMLACFLIGMAAAYIVLRIGRNRFLARSIDDYAKSATRALQTQLEERDATIIELNNRVITMKTKIALMSTHMARAIAEAKLDE